MNFRNTVFRLGSPCADNYGFLVLKSKGIIFGYESENEKFWDFDEESVYFTAADGRVTSRYRHYGPENIWIGHHERSLYPMYLMPVLSYSPNLAKRHMPPLLINSVPKSGTHFAQQIAMELGFQSGATMLTWERNVDDFQYEGRADIDDERPGARGKICPLDVAVAAIPNGTVVLSHAVNPVWIGAQGVSGLSVIHCIRDLRDVLISLYRWKIKKGDSANIPAMSIDTYLQEEAGSDIELLRQSAANIIAHGHDNVIRYEELMKRKPSGKLVDTLMRVTNATKSKVEQAIATARNKPAATFTAHHSDFRKVWTDGLQTYFEESGLEALNLQLGYSALSSNLKNKLFSSPLADPVSDLTRPVKRRNSRSGREANPEQD